MIRRIRVEYIAESEFGPKEPLLIDLAEGETIVGAERCQEDDCSYSRWHRVFILEAVPS